MPTRFVLDIDLGNDAMQTPEDVSGALRRVAEDMGNGATAGRITDENGNMVGTYEIQAAP